jgi:hypothetical protein
MHPAMADPDLLPFVSPFREGPIPVKYKTFLRADVNFRQSVWRHCLCVNSIFRNPHCLFHNSGDEINVSLSSFMSVLLSDMEGFGLKVATRAGFIGYMKDLQSRALHDMASHNPGVRLALCR